jgi:hypothetical protein
MNTRIISATEHTVDIEHLPTRHICHFGFDGERVRLLTADWSTGRPPVDPKKLIDEMLDRATQYGKVQGWFAH